MKKAVRSAIKQAVFGKDFLIGLIAVFTVVLASSFSDALEALRTGGPLENGFHLQLIAGALVSDAMVFALPVIAAMPFAASFVSDLKSGFLTYYLHRTSRRDYLAGRCVACGLSGGLVFVLGTLVCCLISAPVFIPMEDTVSKAAAAPALYTGLLKSLALVFLSGVFWSLCGLTFAAATGSKYMAYASPFILYYVLIILHERYFKKLYVLYPKEWIRPSSPWMPGDIGVFLLLLGLAAAAGAVFFMTAQRRISQL